MTRQVNMQGKKPEGVDAMIPGLISPVAGAVGSYFGGPVGGAVGGAVGGQIGQSVAGGENAPGAALPNDKSSPVDRHMKMMESDPVNQIQQGRAALSGMDEQDRVMLQPVLDEALKKAWQDKQKQQMTDQGVA